MQDLCILRRQFLFLAGSLLVAALPATGAGVQGEVRMLEGEAWRNDLPLKAGDAVAAGDLLRTGTASRLVVRLEGDVYLLRANSILQLEPKGFLTGSLRLLSGALLAVFAPGNKQIMTPAVTAGIRGTGLYAEVSGEGTYFCLCYGEVDLKPGHSADLPFRLKARHHQAHSFALTGGIKKSPLRDHRDDELAILEALAGRTPHQV